MQYDFIFKQPDSYEIAIFLKMLQLNASKQKALCKGLNLQYFLITSLIIDILSLWDLPYNIITL